MLVTVNFRKFPVTPVVNRYSFTGLFAQARFQVLARLPLNTWVQLDWSLDSSILKPFVPLHEKHISQLCMYCTLLGTFFLHLQLMGMTSLLKPHFGRGLWAFQVKDEANIYCVCRWQPFISAFLIYSIPDVPAWVDVFVNHFWFATFYKFQENIAYSHLQWYLC